MTQKTHFIGTLTFVVAYARYIFIPLSAGAGFKTSSLICRPGQMRNIFRLPFFRIPAVPLENSFLFCRPVRKYVPLLQARPGPLKISPLIYGIYGHIWLKLGTCIILTTALIHFITKPHP